METEEAQAKAESTFVTCKMCGDNILENFLERHMAMNHPQEEEEAGQKRKKECPVCRQEMRSEQVIKHGKLAHKVSLKWCNEGCGRYLLKRNAKSHARKHEAGEAINPDDEDEKITVDADAAPSPFNLRVRSAGLTTSAAGAEEPETTVAPLKIKNLNDLMAASSTNQADDSNDENSKN